MKTIRRATGSWASLGAFAVVGLLIAAGALLDSRSGPGAGDAVTADASSNAVRAGALPRGGVREPGQKCEGSKDLTADDLRIGQFTFPIHLPSDQALAGLTSAWVCPEAPVFPYTLFGQVEVTWDAGWAEGDTKKMFTDMVQERTDAEVTELGGHLTFINRPTETSSSATSPPR